MLTSKEKRFLKSEAVNIPALVQIGKEGMTEAVIESIRELIKSRELVKVKINQNSDEMIQEISEELIGIFHCDLVQIIGRNCILFKQKKEKSHYDFKK